MVIDDIDQELNFVSFYLDDSDKLLIEETSPPNRVTLVFQEMSVPASFLIIHFSPSHLPALKELVKELQKLQDTSTGIET